MLLVDTNVWLERLLEQERTEEVRRFLERVPATSLRVTDFSLHSIGIILGRFGRRALLALFVQDVFIDGGVELVALDPADLDRVLAIMVEFRLDFDDAYQYAAAEKFDLEMVSFDGDFDRTARPRFSPGEVSQRDA